MVLLQLEKLYYERYKKINIISVYFTISMPSFTIMALNFHSTQQVSKNSLVHALIKQLKYLQIQNRCFRNWKVHLRIHCNVAICFSFFSKLLMWLSDIMPPPLALCHVCRTPNLKLAKHQATVNCYTACRWTINVFLHTFLNVTIYHDLLVAIVFK